MANTMNSSRDIPSEMLEPMKRGRNNPLKIWNELTAIPEPEPTARFADREAARKSQMTSSVLFFFTVMVLFLLPACYLAPYPSYSWLDLTLLASCICALFLNRHGHTFAAGLLVNVAGFAILTIALFSSNPFDETTLQGYDMYVIIELLAVALLPARSVFLVFVCSVGVILGTLLYIPHTPVLTEDLHARFLIIAARPLGTLLLVAGVAFILSSTMTSAIKRAGQAEMIVRLEREVAEKEHSLVEQKQDLEMGIQQILQTHVAISNGHLEARAPLSQNNVLWQIARALNNLLVRYQHAAQGERELQRVERAVTYYVTVLQQSEQQQRVPVLLPQKTVLDSFVFALQNRRIGQSPILQGHHHHTNALSDQK